MLPTIWCFPFAGASYYSYKPLFKSIEQSHTIKYLELPGRGNRMNEPLLYTYNEVLNDIFYQIKDEIQEPFIFYGHSMGAQLAFDSIHLLAQYNLKPIKLIISGRGAPAVVSMNKRYNLPKPEFKNALHQLGGIPQEILNDDEFFSFFEPILRADFQAIENFTYTQKDPLDVPIHALLGDTEETTPDEASAWEKETTAEFNLKIFTGGHFFILEHTDSILEVVIEQNQ